MNIEPNEMRELLTLAAEYGGLVVRGYDYGSERRLPAVLTGMAKEATRWSSLHNDGDCFRLMVDAGLSTYPPRSSLECAECAGHTASGEFSPRVLTRIAITRAAAARMRGKVDK